MTNYLFDEEREHKRGNDEWKVYNNLCSKTHQRAWLLPLRDRRGVTLYQHSVIHEVTNSKFNLRSPVKL